MRFLIGSFLGMLGVGFAILFLGILFVVKCLGRMKLFMNHGIPGWKAWIPFYRGYVYCELIMGHGWYYFFSLIPFLLPAMKVVYSLETIVAFHQSPLLGVLYFFFPGIAELILAYDKDTDYQGPADPLQQLKKLFGLAKDKVEEAREKREQEQAAQAYDGVGPAAEYKDVVEPEVQPEVQPEAAPVYEQPAPERPTTGYTAEGPAQEQPAESETVYGSYTDAGTEDQNF